jgi:hypothetical protein
MVETSNNGNVLVCPQCGAELFLIEVSPSQYWGTLKTRKLVAKNGN